MTVQDVENRFIWDLIVVYGDAQPSGKDKFLAKLSRILQDSVNSILIGGDFNIIREASEENKPGTPRSLEFPVQCHYRTSWGKGTRNAWQTIHLGE